MNRQKQVKQLRARIKELTAQNKHLEALLLESIITDCK